MTTTDLIQTIWMVISGIGFLWIALRKYGSEISSLDGSSAKSFAEAAQAYADVNLDLRKEILAMQARIDKVEKKKYRITINFEIGDPPSVGIVTIEPILDLNTVSKQVTKKSTYNNKGERK